MFIATGSLLVVIECIPLLSWCSYVNLDELCFIYWNVNWHYHLIYNICNYYNVFECVRLKYTKITIGTSYVTRGITKYRANII